MTLFSSKIKARCPICGGDAFHPVLVGRADTWNQQVQTHGEWKRYRGLPEGAAVAFSEPRLEWDQPTFDRTGVAGADEHMRCKRCASLVPPQFLADPKSRVLLITTGMPQAGKTTWLKCLFNPASKKHLIAEPTRQIGRKPYDYVEPYTIANPDPRTAIPFLLHGMTLTFQRHRVEVAGIDIKGEVFHQHRTTPDKYMRVLHVLENVRSMSFSELFLMFVVPFDPTLSHEHIGRLTSHLTHQPGDRRTWQGVIWTHLDNAELRDAARLLEFLGESGPARRLAERMIEGSADLFDRDLLPALAELERIVKSARGWEGRLDVLESLTWLLYRLMIAYAALADRYPGGKVEFYFVYKGGAGSLLVRQCMRFAAVLFAAWDGAGRGDFSAMIHEAMAPGADSPFPVLPCGLEFLGDVQTRDGEEGMPVWGDLLLLEILRLHV